MLRKIFYFLIIILVISCAGAPNMDMDSDDSVPSGSSTGSPGTKTPPKAADREESEPATAGTPYSESGLFAKNKESESLMEDEASAEPLGLSGEEGRAHRSELFSSESRPAEARPSSSGLKAGFEDDNNQFNYFINFLYEYSHVEHIECDVSERIMLNLRDSEGLSIPNADIKISEGGHIIAGGKTLPDGSFQFNPSDSPSIARSFYAEISAAGFNRKKITIDRDGPRSIEISFDKKREIPEPIPVDILFIMDTTGSMGEEIDRLKLTIELIHLNLSSLKNDLELRFGMVLYKDRGDSYITDKIPLTSDLDLFQKQLSKVTAEGGGDYPEDLQAALDETIHGISWSNAPNAIKLAFAITDATPHLDYRDQKFTYTEAMKAARKMGLKIHTIGTGGLDVNGEYILRQIAQYTGGRYIFLTYGESGESSGGTIGSVSHHTGANYQTDKFESIIIRFTKEEIAWLSSTPLPEDDPWLEARKIESEEKEETLNKLFEMSLSQLVSFSSYTITAEENIAVLPILDDTGNSETAEYFTQQLVLTAAKNDSFTLVERADLNVLIEEMTLQLSGLTEGEGIEEIGEVLEADYLLSSKMYEKDGGYEIFMKLLKVKTAEVVSVTKARLDKNLGL